MEEKKPLVTVRLPEFPKEKEFEEYIAAYFQSDGYFVENNIIYREDEELLEIDLLVTRYRSNREPRKYLIEIKSGGWGFSDVFKIKGWMTFLKEYKRAILIVRENKNEKALAYFKKIAKSLGIKIVALSNESSPEKDLKIIVRSGKYNKADVANWRFSNWTQRKLMAHLKKWKRDDFVLKNGSNRHMKMDEYFYKVNCEIFFTENILDKIKELYSVFQEMPKLAAKCSNEMIGGSFFDDAELIHKDHFKKTIFECELNSIQVAFYLEHLLRLQIFKNAIEYIQYDQSGNEKKAGYASQGMIGETIGRLVFLPQSYRTALIKIRQQPNFHLYPIFWSWFINIFGGFILEDFEEQEFKLFSEKTGLEVSEIATAIEAYGWMFPTSKGWIESYSNSSIKMLKMFPSPLKGVGANYRRQLYSENKDYSGIKLMKEYSRTDLIKWNNSMIDVLVKTV